MHLAVSSYCHKRSVTVYDRSDATATINFSTQYGAATIREQYLYHTRVMYISFSACMGVATIYNEIVAQFSPECGSFSASLIPRLLIAHKVRVFMHKSRAYADSGYHANNYVLHSTCTYLAVQKYRVYNTDHSLLHT